MGMSWGGGGGGGGDVPVVRHNRAKLHLQL